MWNSRSHVFKLWYRWSLFLSSLIALGWGVYTLRGGTVPVAAYGVSHWFDILVPPVLGLCVMLVYWLVEQYVPYLDGCFEQITWSSVGFTLCFVCVFGPLMTPVFFVGTWFLLFAILFLISLIAAFVCSIPFGKKLNLGLWLMGS